MLLILNWTKMTFPPAYISIVDWSLEINQVSQVLLFAHKWYKRISYYSIFSIFLCVALRAILCCEKELLFWTFLYHINENSQNFSDLCVIRAETVAQRCSIKYVFLKVLQYVQERTYAGVYFWIKYAKYGYTKIVKHSEYWCQEFVTEIFKSFSRPLKTFKSLHEFI